MTTEQAPSRFARRTRFAARALLLVLSLCLILGTSACKKTAAKPLYGTWGIDHATLVQEESSSNASDDEKALLGAIVENMQFAFRFDKDGQYQSYLLVIEEEELVEGRYKVLSSTKNGLTLEITGADGEERVAEVTIQGPDRIAIRLDSNAEGGGDEGAPDTLPLKRISNDAFQKYVDRAEANAAKRSAPPVDQQSAAEEAKNAGTQRLVGSWLMDPAATVAQMPDDQQERALEVMRMMRLGIVFNSDNSLEIHVAMMGEREFQAGSYSILEAEADRLAIELIQDDTTDDQGNQVEDEPSTMIVAFLDNDRMIFRPAATEDQSDAELAEETLILKRATKSELHEALNETND